MDWQDEKPVRWFRISVPAVLSLVFACASPVLVVFGFLPAIVLGHLAREECRKDPGGYIQSRAVSLWQYCCERFNTYQFFAASVAGACAFRDTPDRGRVQVPLRIEPHGLVEPFEWLLDQLK